MGIAEHQITRTGEERSAAWSSLTRRDDMWDHEQPCSARVFWPSLSKHPTWYRDQKTRWQTEQQSLSKLNKTWKSTGHDSTSFQLTKHLNHFEFSEGNGVFKKLNESIKWSESHSVVSDSLRPHVLYSPWNSPGQNSGVGSLSLPRGSSQPRGSNPGHLHFRQILYQLSHKGSPRILEWVAYPSPEDLPDPGIKPGSSALQADPLPIELSGKLKAISNL